MSLLHPPFTGFPLAACVFIVLFECSTIFFKIGAAKELRRALNAFLFFTLIISFVSGYIGSFYLPAFKDLVDLEVNKHYFWARLCFFGTIPLLLFGFLVDSANSPKKLKYFYYASLLFQVFLITYVSYLGGQLVFVHGVGVEV